MQELSDDSWVWSGYHQFYLTPDHNWPTEWLVSGTNGIVSAANGVVRVSTGIHTGGIRVQAEFAATRPSLDPADWEDIGETSIHASSGRLFVTSYMGEGEDDFGNLASNGAGIYRVRVCARGRMIDHDGSKSQSDEEYLIEVWPARFEQDLSIKLSEGYVRQTGMNVAQRIIPPQPPRS
ncbi:hypothetical protein OG216_46950 (plasmid) [Streptomycetaceae bacterium NBC_01309]